MLKNMKLSQFFNCVFLKLVMFSFFAHFCAFTRLSHVYTQTRPNESGAKVQKKNQTHKCLVRKMKYF